MPSLFPTFDLPVLDPAVPYCIERVHKQGESPFPVDLSAPYDCDTGPTRMATIDERRFRLHPPDPDCNDTQRIPDGSLLVISGTLIRRVGDGLSIFSGPFHIDSKDPSIGKLFEGWLELYDRVGTYNPPITIDHGHGCADNMEGWLVGQGVGHSLQRLALHATIAGKLDNPLGTLPEPELTLVLNGVIVRSPLPP
jgi:hypothetical protein